MAAAMIAFSLPFYAALKRHARFSNAVSLFGAALSIFALVSKQHNAPLPPVLKIIWFELHVVLAFLSYALFGIAAVLGCFLLKEKEKSFEMLQYKAILVGYCLFSLSVIFGGIWAYLAWGTYWLWTPKELWTTILWLFYSLYLHARLHQWWTGRPAVVLGIAGFGIVMFTYLGVSLLMKSSHAF
jgi:ABC-type transport system involved in cytochrome c biogenesis permease subunit